MSSEKRMQRLNPPEQLRGEELRQWLESQRDELRNHFKSQPEHLPSKETVGGEELPLQ